jgi:threonine dehydratase
MNTITIDDIRAAQRLIRDHVHRTPVLTSRSLNEQSGVSLFFKCENLQKVGAFKARGAANAVFSLTEEEARKGVATHSSGNHAAALARAAKLRGIPAHIVMPSNSPQAKQASVRRYGGSIVLCEPTVQAREATAAKVVAETGATLIHPFDDARVIAGQGTATLELLDEVPDLDVILCPVGGGGLLSGTSVAAKALAPRTRVFGTEPALADDAFRSFEAGKIMPLSPTTASTVGDGLRTSLSELTFAHIRRHTDGIVTVTEESILRAMRTIWEVMKIVIEPSAAVPYAAVLENKLDLAGRRVGIIVSGGNLDLDRLPWMK